MQAGRLGNSSQNPYFYRPLQGSRVLKVTFISNFNSKFRVYQDNAKICSSLKRIVECTVVCFSQNCQHSKTTHMEISQGREEDRDSQHRTFHRCLQCSQVLWWFLACFRPDWTDAYLSPGSKIYIRAQSHGNSWPSLSRGLEAKGWCGMIYSLYLNTLLDYLLW